MTRRSIDRSYVTGDMMCCCIIVFDGAHTAAALAAQLGTTQPSITLPLLVLVGDRLSEQISSQISLFLHF
jgi:hypothetical protein